MAGHTIEPGRVVVFGEWSGSEYVEHQAYIRVVGAGSEFHPDVNLTYSDGVGAAQPANNVKSIETAGAGEDYWRYLTQPNVSDSRPFATQYRPAQGEIVWLAIYDATEGEHFFFLGFVRAIPGAPTDQTPRINCSYYDTRPSVADTVNANNVDPVEEAGATDDYWFKQETALE